MRRRQRPHQRRAVGLSCCSVHVGTTVDERTHEINIPRASSSHQWRETATLRHSRGRAALIDNDYKILSFPKNPKGKKPARMELYNLANDTTESNNLINKQPEIARRMKSRLRTSVKSIEASVKGSDYPEGKVNSPQPPRIFWTEVEAYKPYFEQWRKRPEYQSRLK